MAAAFPEFREAMRGWIMFAIPLLDRVRVFAVGQRFVAGVDGVRKPEPVLAWSSLEVLKVGPEWDAVQTAVANEPRIADQLNRLVGGFVGGVRVEIGSLAAFLLQPFGPRGSQDFVKLPTFNEDLFKQQYSRLEDYLTANKLLYERTMLVSGARFEENIQLSSGISIVRIPDDDPVLQFGQFPGTLPSPLFYGNDSVFAVRRTTWLEKCVGDDAFADPTKMNDDSAAQDNEDQEIGERVLDALALIKSGRVRLSRPITRCLSFSFGLRGSSPIGEAIFGFPLFSADEGREVASFWAALCRKQHNAVALAVRRLAYAMERLRPEDRLLDLMIAAEALLLFGITPAELRYRFALRGAWYYSSDPEQRRACYDFLKHAYDLRSVIAHGGTPSNKDLQFNGAEVSLADVASSMEQFLRDILRRVLRVAGDHADALPRKGWDDEIVGPRKLPQDETPAVKQRKARRK